MPAWLVMAVVWIYVALASYNVEYLTRSMNSIENMVDEAAQIAVVDASGKIVRKTLNGKGKGEVEEWTPGEDGVGPCDEGVAAGRDWKTRWSEGTHAVMDIPIGGVCEILYGPGREEDGIAAAADNHAES